MPQTHTKLLYYKMQTARTAERTLQETNVLNAATLCIEAYLPHMQKFSLPKWKTTLVCMYSVLKKSYSTFTTPITCPLPSSSEAAPCASAAPSARDPRLPTLPRSPKRCSASGSCCCACSCPSTIGRLVVQRERPWMNQGWMGGSKFERSCACCPCPSGCRHWRRHAHSTWSGCGLEAGCRSASVEAHHGFQQEQQRTEQPPSSGGVAGAAECSPSRAP